MAGTVGEQPERGQGDDRRRAAVGDQGQLQTRHRQQADHIADVDEGLDDDRRGDGAGEQAPERVYRPQRDAHADPPEGEVERHDDRGPEPAQFLADDREDEVVGGLGQVEPLGAGLPQPDAEQSAVGQREHALVRLVGRALGVGEISPEGVEVGPDPLEAVGERHGEYAEHHDADRDDPHEVPGGVPGEPQHTQEGDGHRGGHAQVGGDDDEDRHDEVADHGREEQIEPVPRAHPLGDHRARPEDEGELGDLRGLDREQPQVDPALRPVDLGPDPGDQHGHEQSDRDQQQRERRGPDQLDTDAQRGDEADPADEDEERLAQEDVERRAAAGEGEHVGAGQHHAQSDDGEQGGDHHDHVVRGQRRAIDGGQGCGDTPEQVRSRLGVRALVL